jgi:putative hemolysin
MYSIGDVLEAPRLVNFYMPFAPITVGNLTVRLANSHDEVRAAQRLRYEVFCEEMGANSSVLQNHTGIDTDEFDDVCDHMLVLNNTGEGEEEVVGTYRLLRGEVMPLIGRFYTESEFDISQLKQFKGNLLELGRSCVRKEFRTRPTIQLLWRGIGAYVSYHDIGLMFGCVSFAGADAKQHAAALHYLKQYHSAPSELSPVALAGHYVSMEGKPIDANQAKEAFKALPVLIKGYLRLGGMIGDGAYIDKAFNTTDVSIVVRFDTVDEKYVSRYAPESQKN